MAAGHARMAYEQIAPHYDEFTAHHDYELWLGSLLPAASRLGLRGRRLLDVACGTGKSFMPLLERGWEVTACDISESMLARAARKAGGRATLRVADMRELPRLGAFDLVLCLDDAVNYLLSRDELADTLAGLRRNLAPTGVLVFDVNTLHSYRTFFADTVEVSGTGGERMVWRGGATAGTAPGEVVSAVFEIRPGEHSAAPASRAVHRQRHFRPGEVREALAAAGLACLGAFGHGLDARLEQPLDESRHTKAIFIAGLDGKERR